jgi:hypothetical protein
MSSYSNLDIGNRIDCYPKITDKRNAYCDICGKEVTCIHLNFSYCDEYNCGSDYCKDCLKQMIELLGGAE